MYQILQAERNNMCTFKLDKSEFTIIVANNTKHKLYMLSRSLSSFCFATSLTPK